MGVMLVKAYQEFEKRVGATTAKRGAKRDMIRDVVSRLPNEFRYGDLARALPAVSRPTIARALRQLSAERVVRCIGRGRDATWAKLAARPMRTKKGTVAKKSRAKTRRPSARRAS